MDEREHLPLPPEYQRVVSDCTLGLGPLARYPLRVAECRPVRGVVRLDTDQGPVCLKRSESSEGKFHFIHEAIEHLSNKGFGRVARVVADSEGSLYFRRHRGIYYLTNWIDGDEISFHSVGDAVDAARTLGIFHEASKGFEPSENARIKYRWEKWPGKLRTRLQGLKRFKTIAGTRQVPTDFDRLLLRYVDYFYNQGLQALDLLARCNYSALITAAQNQRFFAHHDYTYHNLIRSRGDGSLYIIDFEYCTFDLKSYDLSKLIMKVLKRHNWDFDLARQILDAYREGTDLSHDEYPVMSAFFYFPQRVWRATDRYYYEKRDWPESKFLEKLETEVEHIESRVAFLRRWNKWVQFHAPEVAQPRWEVL